MNPALKPVWGLFFILLAVVALNVVWKATRPKEVIPWRTDYAAAVEEGRSGNKPVFVYFTADWCGPCRSLKHTTWADKDVEAALREYVPVKVDIDHHAEIARRFAIEAVPSYVVLDLGGETVATWDGAMSPARFLTQLKGVARPPVTQPAHVGPRH